MKNTNIVFASAFVLATVAVGCASSTNSTANGTDAGTGGATGGGSDGGSTNNTGTTGTTRGASVTATGLSTAGVPTVASTCAADKVAHGVATKVLASPGTSPTSHNLTVADLNNDGAADIIVVDNHAFDTILSKKDGTFAAPVATSASPGNNDAIAAADFDGDGKMDIVLESGGNDAIDVFLGKGDGTFKIPITTSTMSSSLYKIVPADFNGDGKLDLYLAGTGGEPSILLGTGDGTFSGPGAVFAVSGGKYSASELDFGDLNGDKSADIAFFNPNDNTMCTATGGNGSSFGTPTCYPATQYMNNGDTFTRLGDVNGDGKLDVVALNRGPSDVPGINVWLNKGDGTFEDRVSYEFPRINSNLLVLDANNDKKADLVIPETYSNGQLNIFTSNAGKFPDPAAVFPFGDVQSTSVATLKSGDFLGNGLIGFAALKDTSGNISVMTSTCKP